MKFYIASSTSLREEVKELQKIIAGKGHEISFDWAKKHKPIRPYLKNQKLARIYGIEDVKGIKGCDVFVLLLSESPGIGSTTELGMAMMISELHGKPKVYIVGKSDNLDSNMFYFNPKIIYKKLFQEVLIDLKIF